MISFIYNIYFTGKLKNHSFLVERITLFCCNTIFKVLQYRKERSQNNLRGLALKRDTSTF